jgi:hypothetical protein
MVAILSCPNGGSCPDLANSGHMYGFLIQVASVAAPHAAHFLAENAISWCVTHQMTISERGLAGSALASEAMGTMRQTASSPGGQATKTRPGAGAAFRAILGRVSLHWPLEGTEHRKPR